jgi:hypothetical protein
VCVSCVVCRVLIEVSHEQISSVHLSSVAEDVCYAGGVDSEVVCRNVGAKGTPFRAQLIFLYSLFLFQIIIIIWFDYQTNNKSTIKIIIKYE